MKNTNLGHAEIIIKKAYQHFNNRNIDACLAVMHSNVDWPNGMEGGIEHGHEAVCKYWTRQWTMIDPKVEPIKFEIEKDGRINVTVHQVVHGKDGKLLVDQMIHHIYTITYGLITTMEIKNTN